VSGQTFIVTMIIICLAGAVLIIFAKKMRFILRLLLNACLGAVLIFVINFFTGMFNFSVGVNPMTVLISAVLGVPGVMSLFLIQAIL